MNQIEVLVLGTANPDKAREIADILDEVGIRVVPRPPDVGDVAETGQTLEENARLKAQAIMSASGRPAVADDTGLEVEALDGAPGVWSARYAGEEATYRDNVEKLCRELDARPDSNRQARFVTVAVAVFLDGTEVVASGAVDGRIAEEPRGSGGFGYDPLFIPDEGDGRTFAEMSPSEKHACSHRGRAFRALASQLQVFASETSEDATSPAGLS